MDDHLLSFVRGRRGHFRFESGHHGDVWFDLETLCLNSREIRAFAGRLAAQLKKYQVDVVCGPLVEGAFVALLGCATCWWKIAWWRGFWHNTEYMQ